MDIKKEEALVIILACILFLGFIIFIKPSIVSYVIYQPSYYIYDPSLINTSDNQIKLIPEIAENITLITITTNLQPISAVYNGEDKLSKINSLGNGDVTIHENKNLSITLSGNFQNNDIISIYIKHNKETNINLCSSIGCSVIYSTAHYSGSPSWVNFTISTLEPTDFFNLVPVSDTIKVDYIYATHFDTITNITTIISYPLSAQIETPDIIPVNISGWDYITYTDTLNNQTINYSYSVDSGIIWHQLTDNNISYLNSTKIRIKAVLNSDTTSTPVINSISLFYSEIIQQQENQTQENNQTNTTQPTNTTFIRELTLNETVSFLIYSDSDLSSENIVIILSNLTYPNKQKIKAIEIISQNISFNSATLKIKYLDSEIQNINESTLSFYYFNENNSWNKLDSTINLQENYVLVNLTHFSTYSLLGDLALENQQQQSTSSSSSGSGDRFPSSSALEHKIEKIIPKKQEQKEIKLFETPKIGEKPEEKPLESITTQAVKEVKPITTVSTILFVFLVIILYFIFHKKAKKQINNHLKKQTKKLKN